MNIRQITLLVMFMLVVLGSHPVTAALIMPSTPVNSWLFDEGTGTTANAQFGAVNGSLDNGATWSSDTPFGSGSSVLYDGIDAEVNMGALTYNGATNWTIAMWIRADAIPYDEGFWEAVDNGNGDTWGLRYDAAGANSGRNQVIKTGVQLAPSGGVQIESAANVQTTQWQHIALTFDGSLGSDNIKLYIDGVQDAFTGTGGTSLTSMLFFRLGQGAKGNWDGKIDEVGVWTETLSADNVAWLNQNSLAAIPEPSTLALSALGLLGLIGWGWRRRR